MLETVRGALSAAGATLDGLGEGARRRIDAPDVDISTAGDKAVSAALVSYSRTSGIPAVRLRIRRR